MNKFILAINSLKGLRENIKYYKVNFGRSSLFYYCDFLCAYLIHGASPVDYDYYRMYRLSNLERKNIVTYKRTKKLNNELNDRSADISVIGNKGKFLEKMSELVNREWIVSHEHSINELLSFLEKHDRVFFKPLCGMKGQDIERLQNDANGKKTIEENWQNSVSFILEEEIVQHNILKNINPNSVNTIRIYTLLTKSGNVELLSAVLRTASDTLHVDNMSQGGYVFPIDVKTGIVDGRGHSNVKREATISHPYSNYQVLGITIPFWKQIKEALQNNAKKFPQFRYLGWDLAITDRGIEMVEANVDAGPRLLQTGDMFLYQHIRKLSNT